MARLPLEITSDIFFRCLPPFPQHGVQHFPMLFLNICNAWTDIALSIPALWASIRIIFPRTKKFPELLTTWLQRAHNHPLSVSLFNTSDDSHGVAPIIWQYGWRLKHLELCNEQDDLYEEDPIAVDLLESNPGPLPLLETLRIRFLPNDFPADYPGYRGLQILELLRLAPNLVECTFEDVLPIFGLHVINEALVLPHLHRLSFGNGAGKDGQESDDRILRCLTLPHLQSLSVSMLQTLTGDLLSFLQQSSPPLRELVLGAGFDFNDQFDGIDECLRLVPTLTHLEFRSWPATRNLEELFAAFPSEFLPNLCNLTIRLYLAVSDFGVWWESLLRVLTARRTQIQIVRIMCGSGFTSASQMVANIPAGFRELVAGGMKLYIGQDAQSLISL
ncbi:hypothetical protein B0H11DRAFT_2421476 [Mycena galericulata]|nr:hypothetical protein B0H11DRAFT_2421476 [Mycena galericulata]